MQSLDETTLESEEAGVARASALDELWHEFRTRCLARCRQLSPGLLALLFLIFIGLGAGFLSMLFRVTGSWMASEFVVEAPTPPAPATPLPPLASAERASPPLRLVARGEGDAANPIEIHDFFVSHLTHGGALVVDGAVMSDGVGAGRLPAKVRVVIGAGAVALADQVIRVGEHGDFRAVFEEPVLASDAEWACVEALELEPLGLADQARLGRTGCFRWNEQEES